MSTILMKTLLTADQAIKILRLDSLGLKNPRAALRHLRRTGKLGFVKLGKEYCYTERDIEICLERNHEDATN